MIKAYTTDLVAVAKKGNTSAVWANRGRPLFWWFAATTATALFLPIIIFTDLINHWAGTALVAVAVPLLLLAASIFTALNSRKSRKQDNSTLANLAEQLEGETEARLAAEKDLIKYQAALDDASDAIMILAPDGEIIYVNMSFGLRFHVTREDAAEFDWLQLFRDKQAAKQAFLSACGGSNVKEEFEISYGDDRFPARISLSMILDDDYDQLGILFLITDISEQKKLENKLTELATLDGLTGLSNRRNFDDVYTSEWVRSKRSGESVGVIMIDIDHFKLYNDTYGHQQGDICLKKVAETLKVIPGRPHDLVARYGGEEFVCMLPITNSEGVRYIAELMRKSVAGLKLDHEKSSVCPYVTISIGYCCAVPSDSLSSEQMLEIADDALYQSKNSGRNRITEGKVSKSCVNQ